MNMFCLLTESIENTRKMKNTTKINTNTHTQNIALYEFSLSFWFTIELVLAGHVVWLLNCRDLQITLTQPKDKNNT